MKRILTVISVLLVLFGVVGCSKKTQKYDDFETIEFVNELQTLKETVNKNDGVNLEYDFNKGFDDKYSFVITIVFEDHKAEIKSRSFTLSEIKSGFEGSEVDDVLVFKLDGVKYDAETFELLLDHYASLSEIKLS